MMAAEKQAPEKVVALIGANGMLARMVKVRTPQHCRLHLFDLPEFDMTDRDLVLEVLGDLSPDVIINCAAYTNVDGAESNTELAQQVNGAAVGYLAEAALQCDAILVQVSTDYVFDGGKDSAYVETDAVNPKSVYGRTKLVGEEAILSSGLKRYFILRTSWLYGPGGNNFVETILRLSQEREELGIISDQVGSPTYTADLADAIFNLLALTRPQPPTSINGDSPCSGTVPYGIYHFANEGSCSWYEFACAIIDEGRQQNLPLIVRQVNAIDTQDYPLPAVRPANSVFDKTKYKIATGAEIPSWRDSLMAYFSAREQ